MKNGVKVAAAVTAWLALLIPLWAKTMMVSRASFDFDKLEAYEAIAGRPVDATIRIAVSGELLPDVAEATELVLNRILGESGSPFKFAVSSECAPDTELCVDAVIGSADRLGLDSGSTRLQVEYSETTMSQGRIPDLVAMLLLTHVYADEIAPPASHEEVTVSYHPRYHITFSMFGEGGAHLDWEIGEAVKRTLGTLFGHISATVANITMDSQTGFYAELGCERKSELEQHELSTFVNFAEWSLASNMPYPTLNFVLYVPSSALHIAESSTNSFIVPQWGGVLVADPQSDRHTFSAAELDSVLQVFARQLLVLLGMREIPDADSASRPPMEIRLAGLSREFAARGIHRAASSLGSLRRLAASIQNIAIPEEVVDHAKAAEDEIALAQASLANGDHASAASHAGLASIEADLAFFDKRMMAEAFAPDEQMLAVYGPLIGPLCFIVFLAWIRFYKQQKSS